MNSIVRFPVVNAILIGGNSIALNNTPKVRISQTIDDLPANWDGSQEVFFVQGDTTTPGIANSFGEKVEISRSSKNRMIVSQTGFDGAQTDQGQAHVFFLSENTWTLEQTISNPAPALNGQFSIAVAISGLGSRIAVSRIASGVPIQENIYIYDRIGTVWNLTDVVETQYTTSSTSTKLRLSDDGNILITVCSSSNAQVEIFRWNGSSFVFETHITEAGNTNSFAQGIDLSKNGRILAISRHAALQMIVYEDTTGLGNWSIRDTISGIVNAQTFDRCVGLNEDGEFLFHANASRLNTWGWNGVDYVKVTNDLSVAGTITGGGISEDGRIISLGKLTNAEAYFYQGDGVTEYTLVSIQTPTDPEASGSSQVLSYDGSYLSSGNTGWKISNGQQGRFFTLNVA